MTNQWIETDLSKLIDTIESGGRPKGGASESSGEIPSLGGENIIQTGGITLKNLRRIPINYYKKMKKGILTDRDVLINKDGANTGKVGIYSKCFPDAAINEHLFLIRGKGDCLIQDFLYYKLLSEESQRKIKAKISGSAQPGLKSNFIQSFPVKLPRSITEQATISGILVTIDQVINRTEDLISKYQNIKTGMMQDLLTHGIDGNGEIRDPATHKFKTSILGLVPEEWSTVSLSALTMQESPICYGIVQPGSYVNNGIPVLAIRDLKGNYQYGIHRTDPEIEKGYIRSRVKPGDLLISIKGTTGVVDVVPSNFNGNISRGIAKIRLNEHNNPFFYKYYFESYIGNHSLEIITVGTTRKEISIGPLKSIPIICIDQKEQNKIVQVLASHEELINYQKLKLQKYQEIKSGLMLDLLSGKVSIEPLHQRELG